MQGWWKKPFHKMTKNKLFARLPGLICDILGMLKDYFRKSKKMFKKLSLYQFLQEKQILMNAVLHHFSVWQPDFNYVF